MCEWVLSELTTANNWQEERVPNVSVRSGQGPRLPPPSDFSLPGVPLVVNVSSLCPGHVLTRLPPPPVSQTQHGHSEVSPQTRANVSLEGEKKKKKVG